MFESDKSGIWVEKYRPNTLDTYVGNNHIKTKCQSWIDNGEIPHLLFQSKEPGTGKTTIAKILANSVDSTLLYINASDENNVETVREKIKNFASTMAFTRWKIIILDEADYLTPNAQAALRNLMEEFAGHTRFILTCNYFEKVIEPLRSRCQVFHINPPSKQDVAIQLTKVLASESISFEIQDIATIVTATYPDIRKAIGMCQQNSLGGTLRLDSATVMESNYVDKVIDLLITTKKKSEGMNSIRQLIADSSVRDFTSLYRGLYDELEQYATGHIAQCILIIAEAQASDAMVVDKEINVMAMVIKLLNEIK